MGNGCCRTKSKNRGKLSKNSSMPILKNQEEQERIKEESETNLKLKNKAKKLENLDPHSDTSKKAIEKIQSEIILLDKQKKDFFNEYKKHGGTGDLIYSALKYKNKLNEVAKFALEKAVKIEIHIECLEVEIINIKNNENEKIFNDFLKKINLFKKQQENNKNQIDLISNKNKENEKIIHNNSKSLIKNILEIAPIQRNAENLEENISQIFEETKDIIIVLNGQIKQMENEFSRLNRSMYNMEGKSWINRASILCKDSIKQIHTYIDILEKEVLLVQRNEAEILFIYNMKKIDSFLPIHEKFIRDKKRNISEKISEDKNYLRDNENEMKQIEEVQKIETSDAIIQMIQDIKNKNIGAFKQYKQTFQKEFERLWKTIVGKCIQWPVKASDNTAALQAEDNAKEMDNFIDSIEFKIISFEEELVFQFIKNIKSKINVYKSTQEQELNELKRKNNKGHFFNQNEKEKKFIIKEICRNFESRNVQFVDNILPSIFCQEINLNIQELCKSRDNLQKETNRWKDISNANPKNHLILYPKAYSKTIDIIKEIEIIIENFQIEIISITRMAFEIMYFKDVDKINSIKHSQQAALNYLHTEFEEKDNSNFNNKNKNSKKGIRELNQINKELKSVEFQNNSFSSHFNVNNSEKEDSIKPNQFIEYFNDSVNQGIQDLENDIIIFKNQLQQLNKDFKIWGGIIDKNQQVKGPKIAKIINENYKTIQNYIKDCEMGILTIKENEVDKLVANSFISIDQVKDTQRKSILEDDNDNLEGQNNSFYRNRKDEENFYSDLINEKI